VTESNSWGGPLTWGQLKALSDAGGGGLTEAQLLASGALSEANSWGGAITLRQLNASGIRIGSGSGAVALDPLWAAAGAVPVMDLNFSTGSMVDQVTGTSPITFTRPSTGWAWDGSEIKAYGNDQPRFYVNAASGLRGLRVDPAATNLLLNSAALSTQTVTVAAVPYTLSFYGTGTITLSGASTAGPLVGTGPLPSRASLTFTPTAGALTLTVSGDVVFAQLETGTARTSPIVTEGTALTRAADIANLAIPAGIVSRQESAWYVEWLRPLEAVAGAMVLEGYTGTTGTQGLTISTSADGQRSRVNIRHGTSRADTGNNAAVTVGGALMKTMARISAADSTCHFGGLTTAENAQAQTDFGSRLSIGYRNGGSNTNFLNGVVRRIAIFNGPLTTTIANAMTL
jgi:hypothetical protein